MRFLALVCSKRKGGNSELIARLALREVEILGTSGELLHLGDFSILQCDGCMRCVFKNEDCHLKDDIYKLLDKFSRTDVLFLASPTYVLSIPGILKLVIDRYLLMYPYYKTISGRSAVTVGIAGLPGWEQLQLPLLNLLPLSLGFRVLDSFMAYGAGPGEVLLNSTVVERVKATVTKVCSQANSEHTPVVYRSIVSDHCPVCFSKVFEKIENGKYRCPICLSLGEDRANGLYFSAESLNNHRFTPARTKAHLEDWVLQTKGTFRKRLPDILRTAKQLGI